MWMDQPPRFSPTFLHEEKGWLPVDDLEFLAQALERVGCVQLLIKIENERF